MAKLNREIKADTEPGIDHNDCFFEAPGDPVLTADMDTCSEALAQLDDVIMHTFQQCVYHLTKVKWKKSQIQRSTYSDVLWLQINVTILCVMLHALLNCNSG